jgi:hypothetical protein
MKNQTQKTTPESQKARSKRMTLTFTADAQLAFEKVVHRFRKEEKELGIDYEKDATDYRRRGTATMRRNIAKRLMELAFQAVLEQEGSIMQGYAWWKLILTRMSDEEIAAKNAMTDAECKYSDRTLEPISDAQEAEGIRKIVDSRSKQARHSPSDAELRAKLESALLTLTAKPELASAIQEDTKAFFQKEREVPQTQFNKAWIACMVIERLEKDTGC